MTIQKEYLNIANESLALELMDVSGFLHSIPARFSMFVTDIKDYTTNLVNSHDFFSKKIDPVIFDKIFRQHNYLSLAGFDTFVPPGLKVDVLAFSKVLNDCRHDVNTLLPKTLIPTQRWLATLLANPHNLGSIRNIKDEMGIELPDLKTHKENIAKCFSNNNVSDKVPFQNAFKRTADVMEATHLINVLNEELTIISRKEILGCISEISNAIDSLIEHVDKGDEAYKTQSRVLKDIAQVMFGIAEYIEFFASYSFQLMSLTTAMEDNADRFKKVLH